MILLDLFLGFLKVGCFSFGGGYGMISLIREDCLKNLSVLVMSKMNCMKRFFMSLTSIYITHFSMKNSSKLYLSRVIKC